MKKFYLSLILLASIVSFAQNPLIIKTVGGSAADPVFTSNSLGTNNTWNGKVFYQAVGATPAINLAVTDGTTAGTMFLKNIGTGGSGISSSISQMVAAANFIYIATLTYVTSFSTAKYELWRSDGTTAGTVLLKSFDVTTTSQVLPISNFTSRTSQPIINVVGDMLYFSGYDAANGNELWKSDGTAAGTLLIKDIRPGSSGSFPQAFCRVGPRILFTAASAFGFGDLWQTDGTEAGTVVVKDFSPGNTSFGTSGSIGSALYKGKMYFYASEPATGTEVWSTDGTEAGTTILVDVNPGAATSLPSIQQSLTFAQDSLYLYFVTRLNTSAPYHVWRTDGTTAGTIQLTTAATAIYNSNGVASLGTYPFTNGVYYVGYADSLYKTNGTAASTIRVEKKLYTTRALIAYKGAAWFIARAPNQSDNEVWRSDGLPANTAEAIDIYPAVSGGIGFSSNPFNFFELNNYLYFFADNAAGRHLFRYNGDMTFNGSVAGNNWKDSANWNSFIPPGITDTAYVPAGFTATVTGGNAYAGTLYMLGGSIINFGGSTDSLFIQNSFQGTAATGNGTVVLRNFSGDTARLASAFTAPNVAVDGNATITGNLTINNNLNLTNSARLAINNSNVTLGGTSSTITNTANSYIVTNGTGKLAVENIGAGGRTGAIVFPVGSSSFYNPVIFSNAGGMDVFAVRTEPGIKSSYSIESPTGSSYTNGVVNNTWFITEGIPGGSNAAVTLQWNGLQELPSFNRAQSQFGHYTGGSWVLGPALPAVGADPYSISGSSISSFSPFGIFNSNAVLPVYSVQLTAIALNGMYKCQWNINAVNAAGLQLERSTTGLAFTTLYTGAFTATGYFTDRTPPAAGNVYYRLKVTDQDGNSKYSNVVAVTVNALAQVQVYPTLVRSYFTVQNTSGQLLQLQLNTSDGKLLLSRSLNAGTTVIPASQLPAGNYFYTITHQNKPLASGSIRKQ